VKTKNENKILITGNEACGEGAIQAGCRFYAGYPITPQNELTAYMSKRMDEVKGVFIQAESELAAVNMVFGASCTGRRALTTSSSPGISLKQEGISYLAGCELPAVIVNIMRGGPGLGNITPSQADYFQATKGGGHGDYRLIVLAPSSCQEMFDFTYEAFDLADKYRTPAMILGDGMLGQMMEPIVIKYPRQTIKDARFSGTRKRRVKPWALTGAKGKKRNIIRSFFIGEGVLEEHNKKLQKKFHAIKKFETRFENYKTKNPDIVLIAYGSMARVAKSCVDRLKDKLNIGLMRPITLWPFPDRAIKSLDTGKTKFLTVEMSAGQMIEDVRLAVGDDKRVHFFGRTGGGVPDEEEIIEKALSIKK